MRLKDLAPRRGQPRSRLRRLGEATLSLLGVGLILFILADAFLGIRERVQWLRTNQPVAQGDEARQIEMLRYQIGMLLRPRDGVTGIGADQFGRQIDAALLYARIAELEETRGDTEAAKVALAKGVELLKAAHHPDPTEEHLRRANAAQRAQRPPSP